MLYILATCVLAIIQNVSNNNQTQRNLRFIQSIRTFYFVTFLLRHILCFKQPLTK